MRQTDLADKFDLVVRNADLVTVGGRMQTDLGIAEGRIAQIGGAMAGARELDAQGRLVTPGGVDAHTHLTPPIRDSPEWNWSDDFESGTAAAVAGGITTVGNMSFGPDLETAIADDLADAGRLSIADYLLHPVLFTPDEANLDMIEGLHRKGFTSLKIFLSFAAFDKNVPAFLEAMRIVARCGGITLIHCEDAGIMECCCTMLREAGTLGAQYYPDSRPVQSETVATQRAVGFAETTGCPVYVVHLASARALEACHDGRRRGIPVYVETRPIYLHLTRERYDSEQGAKYAGAPPLREQQDSDALWAGLAFGNIDTLATDHAPWTLAEKLDPAFDATNLRQGVADLETCMPMLYSAGVRTGRLSVEQFVAVTATNPAKLFGAYPQKGAVAVGSDADLVVWDDDEERVIDGSSMRSRADYSPYDGFTVRGWPRWTLSRGDVVIDDFELVGRPGRGRLVERGPSQPI